MAQQRQKLVPTLKLLAQLYDALSQSRRLAGEVHHVGNLFNIQPIHMGKRVMGKRASPVIQDGKEKAVTASQAHFSSYFFVSFILFFKTVSQQGREDRLIPFPQYAITRCFMHANYILGT